MRNILSPEQEGRALVERLGGRWSEGSGGLCRCPAHDDRTPSLSVRPGRTRLLLHCFAGCTSAAVLRALDRARLIEPGAPGAPAMVRDAGDRHRLAALRLWVEARSIAGTPAQDYLLGRGIETSSAELRFHARTPLGRAPSTRFRPALIAAVRDNVGLTGVHRTFLDGAPEEARGHGKFGLGRFARGAVRLGGVSPHLGLAEGLETALSAIALFRIPCWACLGTERFARVSLPPEVRSLILFLDRDPGGRRAETLARTAFAHLDRIEARYPAQAGEDWNDVLRASISGRT